MRLMLDFVLIINSARWKIRRGVRLFFAKRSMTPLRPKTQVKLPFIHEDRYASMNSSQKQRQSSQLTAP
ncbi:hypothetical protein NDU88_003250 [Pleurodeles waltl]|uniref:Uncharacterized protein n=1 Tax=Pleurodeles waltl TaxID=8319 RepID=A0AAV7RDS8_PLEWA|nr:hypothetical protein NDU88_003250 [Pleurodeles waltl]